MENTYFAWLPGEILLKILKKLKHFDLLQFLQAFSEINYKFRNLDLSMEYNIINLKQITSTKLTTLENITSLNVNHLHWLAAEDLRSFVISLINLKSLYAIETKLDLRDDDIKTYNYTNKIEKLAITTTEFIEANRTRIPSVKVLFIRFHVDDGYVPYKIREAHMKTSKLRAIFPKVKKIWVEEQHDECSINISQELNKFQKVFLETEDFSEFENIRRGKYFDSSRGPYSNHVVCIDKLEKKVFCQQPILSCLIENPATDALWTSVLKMLKERIPFSPNATRDLILNKVNLSNICLKELNFAHESRSKNIDKHLRISQMQRNILSSKNAQTLRSLCFMSCVLVVDRQSEQKSEDSGQVCKKPRIGLNSQSSLQEIDSVKKLFENLSNLEELVLCSCKSFCSFKITGHSFISLCTNLRILSIQIPQDCDGELFSSLFKKCKFLEKVKIDSHHTQNEQFNYNFFKAIPMANNLKDLFLDTDYVPIDKFIATLTTMQSKKLQRVVLNCTKGGSKEISQVSFYLLKEFITSFPQLTILLLCVGKAEYLEIKLFNEYLKKLTTHPAQAFEIRVDLYLEHEDPIYRVHSDLLEWDHSSVAGIDPIKDFPHF